MVGYRSLQKALDLGAEGVHVRCNACLNRRTFAPNLALRFFGADACIDDIAKRVRCRCGAKNAHAVAAWPVRARGGSEPLPIVPKDWGRLP